MGAATMAKGVLAPATAADILPGAADRARDEVVPQIVERVLVVLGLLRTPKRHRPRTRSTVLAVSVRDRRCARAD